MLKGNNYYVGQQLCRNKVTQQCLYISLGSIGPMSASFNCIIRQGYHKVWNQTKAGNFVVYTIVTNKEKFYK